MNDPELEDITQRLVDNYVHQKSQLLERAGFAGKMNHIRVASLIRPRAKKMAPIIRGWSVAPDVAMEAVFEWARHNKHPDGPLPSLLTSEKYLAKALGHYLQVPYEVVMQKRSQRLFMERMDFECERMRKEFAKAGVTDLVTASSYPVEFRYLVSVHRGDRESMFWLAPDLLKKMEGDARTTSWLRSRGIKHEHVAAQFNSWKRRQQAQL